MDRERRMDGWKEGRMDRRQVDRELKLNIYQNTHVISTHTHTHTYTHTYTYLQLDVRLFTDGYVRANVTVSVIFVSQ